MPFFASYAVTGDISVELVGGAVAIRFPTGERTLRLAMSRHRARAVAQRAIWLLDKADREQAERLAHMRTEHAEH